MDRVHDQGAATRALPVLAPFVVHAQGKAPLPIAGVLVGAVDDAQPGDLAQHSLRDPVAKPHHNVAHLGAVGHAQLAARLPSLGEHRVSVRQGGGDRLFHQHVLARRQCLDAQRRVHIVGRGDVNRVHVLVAQQLIQICGVRYIVLLAHVGSDLFADVHGHLQAGVRRRRDPSRRRLVRYLPAADHADAYALRLTHTSWPPSLLAFWLSRSLEPSRLLRRAVKQNTTP